MAKKKWSDEWTYCTIVEWDFDDHKLVDKTLEFPKDPLKFGIAILKWYGSGYLLTGHLAREYKALIENAKEKWKDLYEKDNSIRIEDCIEEITDGAIEFWEWTCPHSDEYGNMRFSCERWPTETRYIYT